MLKILLSIFILMITISSYSQEDLNYQKPSAEILRLVDYERPPSVIMDDKKEIMVFLYRNTYKSLSDLNQEELRLGGIRINPVTNISSTINYINNIKVLRLSDKSEKQIKDLPTNPKIAYLTWSPDETKIAFTNTTDSGVELWYVDLKSYTAKKISKGFLNANTGNPITWFKDSKHLLINKLPTNKASFADNSKSTPQGPIVTISDGRKAQNRTYQDLLKNKTDEFNFEKMVESEIYKISLDGNEKLFLEKNMYVGLGFSPDGNYISVTALEKPFSYLVPYSRFPMITNIYSKNGDLIKTVNQIPLSEILPKGFMAVREGKRSMAWRSDKPATLYYVEALDKGDPANKVDFRDELFLWDAPFKNEPYSIFKTINRFSGVIWGDDNNAIVSDMWYDSRNVKKYKINPGKDNKEVSIIEDRNSQDIYSDPGEFLTKKNEFGLSVLHIENNTTYLIGDGFTKDGKFPFVDEYNIANNTKRRIFTSEEKDKLVSILDYLPGNFPKILMRMESKSDYPNYFFQNIKNMEISRITDFKNPFESIKDVYKKVIKYKRSDGVELSGTLYLPLGYDINKKEKVPLLIWAYPAEYKDKNSAGQSNQNPNEFTFPGYGSFIYWVTKGYAVLDDASFPILGEGSEEPNDTFIQQLIDNAKSAIDAVDNLGFIDREKVAIGGHSYGAFMTANLLTHSDLFACGVARSGAYNRTLTPFGFQNEQRNYWEAKEVYDSMSPFMNVHKMKLPILLVHGESDNNPGTFTLQTERYFQALKGFGAPARMVILPKESHGYVAKENILHLLWEQDQFFEKYLKK